MNVSHFSNENDDALTRATAALRDAGDADGPPPLVLTRTAARQAAVRHRRQRTWALVAAALALAAVPLGVGLFGRGEPAFAQVLDRVARTRTVQWSTADSRGPQWYYVKGDRMRWETWNPRSTGKVSVVTDRTRGEQVWHIDDETRVILTRKPPETDDLYDTLRQVGRRATKGVGVETVNGRRQRGYRGLCDTPGPDGRVLDRPVIVWVDEQTGLPARVQYPDEVAGGIIAAEDDIRFDVPLDDRLFAMTPPAGYAVRDDRNFLPARLRPPPTTQQVAALVLRPGVGIGDLKLGDPPAAVAKALGPPENTTDGPAVSPEGYGYHRYPSLGLLVTVINSGVDEISAYGDGALAFRTFAGRTDRGIGIGSRRQDLEAAYGRPEYGTAYRSLYVTLGLAVYYYADGQTVMSLGVERPKPYDPAKFADRKPTSAPARQN